MYFDVYDFAYYSNTKTWIDMINGKTRGKSKNVWKNAFRTVCGPGRNKRLRRKYKKEIKLAQYCWSRYK